MICPNCNRPNNNTAEYCYNCGYKLHNNFRNTANNIPNYMPPTNGATTASNNPPANSKIADRLAVLSFIFALSNVGISILLVVLLAVADSLLSNQTFGWSAFWGAEGLSFIVPLIITPLFILSIVFSFVATAKKTKKNNLAIAARIIVFSEFGISVLFLIGFIAFAVLVAMNGPYY